MSTPKRIVFRGATYRLVSAQHAPQEYDFLKDEILEDLNDIFATLTSVTPTLMNFGKYLEQNDPKFNELVGAHLVKDNRIANKLLTITKKMIDVEEMSDRARDVMLLVTHA